MRISEAVAALGPGPLTEDSLRRHMYPLFSRTLAAPGIYLANHSLGRPLDQTEDDLREGFQRWQTKLHNAWEPWQQEEEQHRARIAQLIGAPRPDCIVPKVSAGQGLRTVLNALTGSQVQYNGATVNGGCGFGIRNVEDIRDLIVNRQEPLRLSS